MTRARYALGALNTASECVICGEATHKRVDLVVADGVVLREGSCPLCDVHAGAEASRWVQVTLVLGTAKLLPVVGAWLMARALDVPQVAVVGLALALALALAGVERLLLARLQPFVRVVGRDGEFLDLEIRGEPPDALTAGGPPPRSLSTTLHRSRQRLPVVALVAVASAVVAGWQWSLARPTLHVHNPGAHEATVQIDDVVHTVAPGASVALSPGAGRHRVVLTTPGRTLELPVQLAPGQPMLLATEPACYAIGVPATADMLAEGQLFTLGTGDWRPAACGE